MTDEMNDLPTPPPAPKPTPADEMAARLYVLAVNLRAAKETEECAKARRIEIEEMIAKSVPGPESGQVTVPVKGGLKLVVKRGFNYQADLNKIQHLWDDSELPIGNIMAPIKSKTTHELDAKGYEWYRENHPDVFSLISQHVTVTPKKVSVVLKSAEE